MSSPSKRMQEAIEAARQGATPQQLKAKGLSQRSAYRAIEKARSSPGAAKPVPDKAPEGTTPPKAPPSKAAAPESLVGQGTESFAPIGQTADKPQPQWLVLGTFRMPFEDWGYSSARNLLLVADTYQQAKAQYKFDSTMKVGDFLAQLCQAFRTMLGWDTVVIHGPIEIQEGGDAGKGLVPKDYQGYS